MQTRNNVGPVCNTDQSSQNAHDKDVLAIQNQHYSAKYTVIMPKEITLPNYENYLAKADFYVKNGLKGQQRRNLPQLVN